MTACEYYLSSPAGLQTCIIPALASKCTEKQLTHHMTNTKSYVTASGKRIWAKSAATSRAQQQTSGGKEQSQSTQRQGHKTHLASQVATLLLRSKLVLKVYARSTSLNHALHQLETVQGATESSLCICNNGHIPVVLGATLCMLNLVTTLQGIVDALDVCWHTVGWVEGLVRVHLQATQTSATVKPEYRRPEPRNNTEP